MVNKRYSIDDNIFTKYGLYRTINLNTVYTGFMFMIKLMTDFIIKQINTNFPLLLHDC